MTRQSDKHTQAKVRLDKWLWAARFYKTRSMAKQAIDGGKVHCDGVRAKPGKEVSPGLKITLRQGFDEKTVIVANLSEKRRGATEAQLLYEETAQSLEQRKQRIEQRKSRPFHLQTEGRPSKRDRRLIHRFKQSNSE
ncbi:MAG: RNA-binding protein [Gammaproteobacteria bacterium]|nr:RNA-binding protein [Gammaproteobacteria bacterium]